MPSDTGYVLDIPGEDGKVSLQPSPQPARGYPMNTTITLTANAQLSHSSSPWTGDFSGVVNPSSLPLDVDSSLSAVFNPVVQATNHPSDAAG